ncbi:hypothetical protein MRX96_027383 [Rhipicephalus microplus]
MLAPSNTPRRKRCLKVSVSSGERVAPERFSTMPVLEEHPEAVGVTMKELPQRVDRYRSMGHTCVVVADYLEVHHGEVRRLISSIGSAVFAMNVSAGGRNISSMKHQFKERARMRFLRSRTDILYEQNRPDERNVWKNLHLPEFGSARSCVAESPRRLGEVVWFPGVERSSGCCGRNFGS